MWGNEKTLFVDAQDLSDSGDWRHMLSMGYCQWYDYCFQSEITNVIWNTFKGFNLGTSIHSLCLRRILSYGAAKENYFYSVCVNVLCSLKDKLRKDTESCCSNTVVRYYKGNHKSMIKKKIKCDPEILYKMVHSPRRCMRHTGVHSSLNYV